MRSRPHSPLTPPSGSAPPHAADWDAAGAQELGQLLKAYLEGAPVAMAVVSGADHRLVFANAAFLRLSTPIGDRMEVGTSITDLLSSAAHQGLAALLDRVRRDGVAVHDAHTESSYGQVARDGSAKWCYDVWPVRDLARPETLIVSVRATGRRERTGARQRAITERLLFGALREQELAQRADSSRARAVFLADSSRRLGASFELSAVYAAVARVALPKVGAWSIVNVDKPDGTWRRLPIVHPDSNKQTVVVDLAEHWSPAPGDPIGIPVIGPARQSVVVSGDINASLVNAAHGPDNLRALRALELGPLLVVPLVAHGRLRGAITFVGPPGSAAYTSDDVHLAEDLGKRCADLVDGAHLYEEARQAQARADRSRTQADLARTDAERANHVKMAFLTSMSHELRTPLNAIVGYTELLTIGLRGPVSAEQIEALGRIRSASTHLLGLINDVLNFAKLKASQVPLALADVSVSEVLDNAVAMLERQAVSKGLAFTRAWSLPELTIRADREKVLQILLNLLSNAIKFTDTPGHVEVGAALVERRRRAQDVTPLPAFPAAPMVALTVRDDGRGVASDQLNAIFEPFVQLARSLTETNEGTGLGLAISRDLARAMGGDVTVESTLGQGSTFTLTMPCAPPR